MRSEESSAHQDRRVTVFDAILSLFPLFPAFITSLVRSASSVWLTFLTFSALLTLAAAGGFAAQEKDDPIERPEVPEARAMVLEQLVPTKMLSNTDVLRAMMRTDRALFVPKDLRAFAFQNITLPIGAGQTISPPFVVAYMTETLEPKPTDKVLEIGTGSGYQAAILSPLVKEVYTIEIVPSLGKKAAETLKKLDYANVRVKVGDGYQGWPDAAPFDKIIVTCSPENIPQPLIDQLADGGTMLIPVGERYHQHFIRVSKKGETLEKETLTPAFFVPMTGEAESERTIQPDPLNPSIRGGDFETSEEDGTPTGWYFSRNVQVKKDLTAPGPKKADAPKRPKPDKTGAADEAGESGKAASTDGRLLEPLEGGSVMVFDNREIEQIHRKKDAVERARIRERIRKESDGEEEPEEIEVEIDPLTERQRDEELTAHVLQGFPVDGRKVKKLRVACQLEASAIRSLENRRVVPVGRIVFFDADREAIGDQIVLAVQVGDTPWRDFVTEGIAVPRRAREGSLCLGILGGVGVLKIDNVQLEKD